jgi:hypothetical protein
MKKPSAHMAQNFQPRLDNTIDFTIIIPRLIEKRERLISLTQNNGSLPIHNIKND